jgi:predicted O-linked N-acetylglucosamine transferase (SPINDLY family)
MDSQTQVQEGLLLQRAGRHVDAVRVFEQVLDCDPDNFDALQLLGLARFRSGDPAAGIVLLERALAIHAGHGPTLNNLGNALLAIGDFRGALAAYRRAAAALPAPNSMVLRNIGIALYEGGDLDDARSKFEDALKLNPRDPIPWNWIGRIECDADRDERAAAAVAAALSLDPNQPDAYLVRGIIESKRKNWTGALQAYDHAIAMQREPGSNSVLRFGVMQHLALWDGWELRARELILSVATVTQPTYPMTLMYATDDAGAMRAAAGRYASGQVGRAAIWAGSLRRGAPAKSRARIRVGYLSADIRNHPVAQLLAGVLEHHDRGAFDIRVYATGAPSDSPFRARIEVASDRFLVVESGSQRDIAQLVAEDEVDVLVDLLGHTEGSCPQLLAARPAPVQVSWLGYPGTVGGGLVDYLIADPTVAPAGSESAFGEALARLPGCYLPSDRRREVAAPWSRAHYDLPDDAVVLCCFGQAVKLTPLMFAIWMDVLRECPAAVLWLASPSAAAQENLRHEADVRGVAPSRIVFAPKLQDQAEHLARYAVADLTLDTFPYGSHSTAIDSLWVGCPIVALAGRAFHARVSASVLSVSGLSGLTAATLDEYRELVLGLVRDPQRLLNLRRDISAARSQSRLFDVARFTVELETLYGQMHARRVAGLPPAPIGADGGPA